MAVINKLIGSESPLEVGLKINEIIDCKANIDLSNLSSTGQAKFDEKANKTELATQLAKKLDSSAVTAYVKARYANGYSWYRWWSDGYLEQGGITGSSAGNSARTVTFIKPFTSGLVSIVTNGAFGGSNGNPYMSFFQITGANNNNFTAVARCGEGIQMYWVARGYA
jgi:hypothetical protein